MTQAVLAPVIPVAAAPVPQGPSASEAGEPTMEELAASLPDPTPTTSDESAAEAAAVLDPAAPVEETAATDETTEAAPAPEDAAEVDRLERAAKAAAKAREGSRRFRETQEQLRQQSLRTQQAAREAEQHRQEAAAARQEAEAARQREADYQRDPYKALKGRGMTDVELAQRALREGTPEALIAQEREERMALQKSLEAERGARLALEQRLEAQAAQARAAQAETAFHETAKDVDLYPELAVRRPAARLVAARAAMAEIRANGYDPSSFTNAQIAEAAELWLAPEKPRAAAAPKASAPVVPKPLAKTSGKTLTNAAAAVKTTATAGWDSLTDEQQMAHLAAQLPEPTT